MIFEGSVESGAFVLGPYTAQRVDDGWEVKAINANADIGSAVPGQRIAWFAEAVEALRYLKAVDDTRRASAASRSFLRAALDESKQRST